MKNAPSTEKVKVYTIRPCPYCDRAKQLLKQRGVDFEEILVSQDDDAEWERLARLSGMQTMPQIFKGDRLIGGYSELAELDRVDQLKSLK